MVTKVNFCLCIDPAPPLRDNNMTRLNLCTVWVLTAVSLLCCCIDIVDAHDGDQSTSVNPMFDLIFFIFLLFVCSACCRSCCHRGRNGHHLDHHDQHGHHEPLIVSGHHGHHGHHDVHHHGHHDAHHQGHHVINVVHQTEPVVHVQSLPPNYGRNDGLPPMYSPSAPPQQ